MCVALLLCAVLPSNGKAAITLISTGAVWKYLDTGTNPGPNWAGTNFNDGTWLSGPAQLGYGDADEATAVGFGPDVNNRFVTTHFRRAFVIADPSAFTSLTVSLKRDDGGIVYLNGTEVFRENMPTGTISHLTLATTTAADDGANYFTNTVSAALLLPGTNIVAVEIHQSAVTSSDISFDLALTGEMPDATRPGISNVPDQTTNEDAPITIPFTVTDPDTPVFRLALSATSGNTALVPAGNIFFDGSGANRTVTIVPASDQSGSALITLAVSDETTNATDTFVLTVNAVNDRPTLNAITNVALEVDFSNKDIFFNGISSGAPNESQTLTVTAVSSNTALVTINRVNYSSGATNGSVRLASPSNTGTGTAVVAVTVSDGVSSVTRAFTVFVWPSGNVMPTLSAITNQITAEDTPTPAIPFTVGDSVTPANLLNLAALSSNPDLVPSENIFFGGGGSNRTVTVTPAANESGICTITVFVNDTNFGMSSRTFTLTVNPVNDVPLISPPANQSITEDSTVILLPFTVRDVETPAANLTVTASSSNPGLVPAASILLGGSGTNRALTITPVPNQFGAATITLTASDSAGGISSTNFVVNVTPVNDAPVVSTFTDLITNEDTPTAALPFTIGDLETPAANLAVIGTSSDLLLVPEANITFGGSGTSRSVTVTPAANRFGTATITVTIRDAEGLAASNSFGLTVLAVNDSPIISGLADQSTGEDTPKTIAFSISDEETPAASLVVTGTSSDVQLVPNAIILLSGSGTNRTVTVMPATNRVGSATIYITVTDANGGSSSNSFVLTVNAENDLPVISTFANQIIDEDHTTPVLAFSVSDEETAAASLTVTASSSNPALAPTSGISIGGSGSNRTVTVTPLPDQSGTATITLTVGDDAGGINATSFVVTVNPVNDAPLVSNIGGQVTSEDTPTGAIPFTVNDVETAAGNLLVTASSSDLALVPNAGIALEGSGPNRQLIVTPAPNRFGSTTITLTVGDAEGLVTSNSFMLTVNAVNDVPEISILPDLETVGTLPVSHAFTIADLETTAGSLALTADSSNPGLIPTANIVFGGSEGNRSATVTAAPGRAGSAMITLTVTDGDGGAASNSFMVTVTPPTPVPPTITSQPQSQTVIAGANVTFHVAADGTEPLGYQWKFNGTALSEHQHATLKLVNVQGADAGGYQVVVTNQAGVVSSAPAVLTVASGPLPPIATLVPRGADWKYLDSGDSPGPVANAQNTGWAQRDFDDAGWASGPAQLGWGDGDEVTVMNLGAALRPTTTYLRHAFVVTNSTFFFTYTLRVLCDDGAIIYINGQQVARVRMPSGPVSSSTPAASIVEGGEESEFIQRAAFAVGPGTNVVAVELHQAVGGRNDASFDLELLAGLPLTPPSISLLTPVDRQEQASLALALYAAASDLDGHVHAVHFFANGDLIGSDLTPPYEMVWEAPGPGRYAIQARAVDNYGYSTYSPVAHVQLGEPAPISLLRGPYLQSGSSTSIVVCWRTDWYVNSVVRYGTNPAALDIALTNATSETEHAMRLTGLLPDTKYFYEVGLENLLLSGGQDHHFVTAPTNDRPVRFWAIGDFGTGSQVQYDVRDGYQRFLENTNYPPRRTDLWLMLGDNAYDTGSDGEYQRGVFDAYPSLLRQSVAWPTIGNHDVDSNGEVEEYPYLEIFHLPRNGEAGGVASGSERYYSFDYANIHFVCLDATSSDRSPGAPMLTWLEQDLMSTEKDWIVAFWHQPPYTYGTHNSDFGADLIQMRQNAVPILERYGVDLVLCGHSHVYERSCLLDGHYGFANSLTPGMVLDASLGQEPAYRKPAGGIGANRGAVYVVCGNSGQGGFFNFPRHPAHAVNLSGFGSVVVDVDGLRMDVKFLRETGVIDDSFTIDKSQPAAGMKPMLRVDRVPGALDFSWPTSLPTFQLQSRATTDPAESWLPIPYAPTLIGRSNFLRLELTPTNQFFRLRAEQ
jgi:Calcineurin-like phosphoesterase/Immunoglobulin domain/Purple acid Phosphatase, N-terminal domain/Bacterial Ig domain